MKGLCKRWNLWQSLKWKASMRSLCASCYSRKYGLSIRDVMDWPCCQEIGVGCRIRLGWCRIWHRSAFLGTSYVSLHYIVPSYNVCLHVWSQSCYNTIDDSAVVLHVWWRTTYCNILQSFSNGEINVRLMLCAGRDARIWVHCNGNKHTECCTIKTSSTRTSKYLNDGSDFMAGIDNAFKRVVISIASCKSLSWFAFGGKDPSCRIGGVGSDGSGRGTKAGADVKIGWL